MNAKARHNERRHFGPPLQGSGKGGAVFPGRCPGLVWVALSALDCSSSCGLLLHRALHLCKISINLDFTHERPYL